MKFGVNTWVWSAHISASELETLALHIAGLGFDHIELPFNEPGELNYKKCREMISKAGIDSVSFCAVMTPERDLIHTDPRVRRNGAAYSKSGIDGLSVMGGKNLVGNLYSAVGRTWQQTAAEREKDVEILVGILRDVSQYADAKGVVLGVEPLNRYETSFINTADQVIELVDRVDHPSCKVLLDTFHMNMEENSMGDAIRKVGQRLLQVHSIESHRGTPGTGLLQWEEIAKALKDIHFDGELVMESFTFHQKSIARAAAIRRPLAATQDELALDGVNFLKRLMK
jgi:D-psicose/D-tagatose/L-ribulose 3-epimerase